jgi:hypothetical protein
VKLDLATDDVGVGAADGIPDVLYDHVYIDPAKLQGHIDACLQETEIVTLNEIVSRFPLEHGLAEIVGYLRLASGSERAVVLEERQERVSWETDACRRSATVPLVVYRR